MWCNIIHFYAVCLPTIYTHRGMLCLYINHTVSFIFFIIIITVNHFTVQLRQTTQWKSLINLLFQAFDKKGCQINRLAKRLLIVSTNLGGVSLVNHEHFAWPNLPNFLAIWYVTTVRIQNKKEHQCQQPGNHASINSFQKQSSLSCQYLKCLNYSMQ